MCVPWEACLAWLKFRTASLQVEDNLAKKAVGVQAAHYPHIAKWPHLTMIILKKKFLDPDGDMVTPQLNQMFLLSLSGYPSFIKSR